MKGLVISIGSFLYFSPMSLADQPHLYIIGTSLLINITLLFFIFYNLRERRKIHILLDAVNRSLSEKNQVISEHTAQLEEAYENLWKINQQLQEDIYLKTDKVTIQHRQLVEYIQSYTHKMRGTLASMTGLLLLARNEEMSQSLDELLELMNTCTRQLEEIVRDFTQKVHDGL